MNGFMQKYKSQVFSVQMGGPSNYNSVFWNVIKIMSVILNTYAPNTQNLCTMNMRSAARNMMVL